MEALLVVALALACPLIPLIVARHAAPIPYVSPLHIVAFMVFLGTTVKVVAVQWYPELSFYSQFANDSTAYLDGLIFVLLFVMMLSAGYVLGGGSTYRTVPRFGAPDLASIRNERWILPLALGAIALVSAILLAQRGITSLSADSLLILNSQKHFEINAEGVGSTGALLKTLYTIPRALFIVAVMIAVASGRSGDRRRPFVIGAALCLTAVLTGDRFDLVRIAGFALVGAVLAGWRPSAASLPTVLGAGGVAIGLAGLMSVWRQGVTVADAGSNPLKDLASQMVGSTYFLDINVASVVIERADESVLLNGQSYLTWIYGWIPRAFWPDKPAVDVGVYMKREIFGASAAAPGGINATGPGEAFLNFGWYGLIVPLILGFLFRHVERYLFQPGPGRLRRMLFYPSCMFLSVIAMMQSSFSGTLVALLAIVPLTGLVCLFLIRSDREPGRLPALPRQASVRAR